MSLNLMGRGNGVFFRLNRLVSFRGKTTATIPCGTEQILNIIKLSQADTYVPTIYIHTVYGHIHTPIHLCVSAVDTKTKYGVDILSYIHIQS